MNLEDAIEILEVEAGDGKPEIRKKYRSLMRRFHPDVLGSDRPEQIQRAQEMNEAYRLLMEQDLSLLRMRRKKRKWQWTGTINEQAFCERNVYLYYSMEVEGEHLYYQAVRGKYLWDPDEEEFRLFMTSLHHASRELLEQVERKRGFAGADDIRHRERRFKIQAELFHLLTQQFIDPVQALKKVEKPKMTDKDGREIYRFRAWVGVEEPAIRTARILKKGDLLYPKAFQGHQILVKSGEGVTLGHLSFDEDYLYFCMIPLLRQKCAKIRMHVRDVKMQGARPYRAKVDLDFYFRLEKEAEAYRQMDANEEIRNVLSDYAKEDWISA